VPQPKGGAPAIIGKMLRADIQKLVEELQAYLHSPVLQ
jgi:hypothetical protein